MMTKKQADGFINRNEYSGAFTDANGQEFRVHLKL